DRRNSQGRSSGRDDQREQRREHSDDDEKDLPRQPIALTGMKDPGDGGRRRLVGGFVRGMGGWGSFHILSAGREWHVEVLHLPFNSRAIVPSQFRFTNQYDVAGHDAGFANAHFAIVNENAAVDSPLYVHAFVTRGDVALM